MKVKMTGQKIGYSRIDLAKASGTGLSTIDNAIRDGELKAQVLILNDFLKVVGTV